VLLSARSYIYFKSIFLSADILDPKEIYAINVAHLTVVSRYKSPIIIATLLGYLNVDGCIKQAKSSDALAMVTILSEKEKGGTLFQDGTSKRVGMKWETNFHLNVSPPSSFEMGDLCYEVHWRVEYVDYESSITDFPSKTCSFSGSPKFRRPWNRTEFNPSGPTEEWLVRKSNEERWDWSGHFSGDILKDGSSLCPSSSFRERDYSVVFIGDSQPFYMCQHLVWFQSSKNLRCVQIKQTLGNASTFYAYANELQNATESVVVFNPSGLWEAAYGKLDLFRENFQLLLDFIPSRRKQRQNFFFAPTTAVHPINYASLKNDVRKWSMTQVRIRAINTISKQLVRHETDRRVGDTVSVRVLPTPIDALSLNREDDPKTPNDMRHFGNLTNEMLLRAILCDLD
jgi:hypothetical protein